jgi:hypothetical protein
MGADARGAVGVGVDAVGIEATVSGATGVDAGVGATLGSIGRGVGDSKGAGDSIAARVGSTVALGWGAASGRVNAQASEAAPAASRPPNHHVARRRGTGFGGAGVLTGAAGIGLATVAPVASGVAARTRVAAVGVAADASSTAPASVVSHGYGVAPNSSCITTASASGVAVSPASTA